MEKIIKEVFERAKKIFLSPQAALTEVKSEEMNIADTMKNYVAIIAAIPAAALIIGSFGRADFFNNLVFAILVYVMSLGGVILLGKIVNALAEKFGAAKDEANAFKLAVYCTTPMFIYRILNINPKLSLFALLVGILHGIYIIYVGLPILMDTSEEKNIPFIAASVGVTVALIFFIGFIAMRVL